MYAYSAQLVASVLENIVTKTIQQLKLFSKKTNANILRKNLTFVYLFNFNDYFCEIISKQKQLCY
jgi:hypothetical protein